MDIKTISATLALLGSSALLPACDSKKDAAEVKKDEKADAKTDVKAADAKADGDAKAADAKGEMACGEGKCGGDKAGDAKAADAKGEMACGEGKCGGDKAAAAKAGEGDAPADAANPDAAKKDAT
jgi:uncharacterized low-complexity protein